MLKTSPEMRMLIEHSHLFVSKQCADTHAGYAMSQIKKARGQNKWVNNPKPVEPPRKEDLVPGPKKYAVDSLDRVLREWM